MNLHGIIFDMDGTLGDTMPVVLQALQETFIRYAGKDYSHQEIMAMFGPSEEGVIAPRVAEAVYPAALRHYLNRYATLHQIAAEPFPGVMRLLTLLQARGIRRGVVTGKGRGTADISMAVMGLAPYIDSLVTGSAAGAEKPEAIRQVLDEWGIAPENAAYVGDMPYDMRAARQAGVFALGAAWAKSATVKAGDGADQVFYTVDELIDWLDQ